MRYPYVLVHIQSLISRLRGRLRHHQPYITPDSVLPLVQVIYRTRIAMPRKSWTTGIGSLQTSTGTTVDIAVQKLTVSVLSVYCTHSILVLQHKTNPKYYTVNNDLVLTVFT